MPKSQSPLLGYNNNLRYKGRVFHIQTEDSGIRYGHIMTHLFIDGGRILKSVKTSYVEHLESEARAEIVRDLMRSQHKAMAIALRDGRFDAMVEGSGDGASGGQTAAGQTSWPPPSLPPPSLPPSASPSPEAGRDRRPASRPSSAFAQVRPLRGQSIFGEDLLSDRSLDEVILSYLAAEASAEKK
jgi:hypothetical protein